MRGTQTGRGPSTLVVALLAAILVSVTIGAALLTAKKAGADPGQSALVTHYNSAPGHGPSLSAYCATTGIVIGYHPWDHGHRNFQVWQGLVMLVNTNDPDQSFEVPFGDYTIRYIANDYIVRGDLCDTRPTTTTEPSTTTTSVAPTTTTGSSTTTTEQEPAASTTTSTEPEPTTSTTGQSPTTSEPTTSQPATSSTETTEPSSQGISTLRTFETTPIPTGLDTSSDELPYTGFPTVWVVLVGGCVLLSGIVLVSEARRRTA